MARGETVRGPAREPPSARTVAARVLERVEKDGAFAAAALDTEIDKHPQLDRRDRALATEITYGVLRTAPVLAARIAAHAPRGLPKDTAVVSHLLVAAYQILLLERVPASAAVDAAVSAIRAIRGAKVAGFANALLRKVAAGDRLDRAEAVVESGPPWLLGELTRSVGEADARALFGAEPPAGREMTSIRVRSGVALPDWLAGAEPGRASPVSRLVPRSGDLRGRPGFREGAFLLQEEGAQVVALALGARPGDRVLDACTGRGQKAALLREQVGARADLWATDLYPEKLAVLAAEFARLGLVPPTTRAVDYTAGTGEVPLGFDRVLVDAPCTGTGTLARRPEIARRLRPEDPERLGHLSEAILRRATTRAKPGGCVVFAVCSVLEAECEAVVRRVADVLEPSPFDAKEIAHVHSPEATSFRLLPLAHGTDGFFVASFVRKA